MFSRAVPEELVLLYRKAEKRIGLPAVAGDPGGAVSVSRKAFTVAAAVLVLVLGAGVAAGLWYGSSVREQGGTLTGAEIRLLIAGNTVKGTKFSEYYAADGSIRGREIEDADEQYVGTWHIEGDQLCVAFPSHDVKNCVSIARGQGGAYDFADAERHSKRTIVAGNPDNL